MSQENQSSMSMPLIIKSSKILHKNVKYYQIIKSYNLITIPLDKMSNIVNKKN